MIQRLDMRLFSSVPNNPYFKTESTSDGRRIEKLIERINEKIWTVNYCSVVATSHDKWTYENLVKEIFFAFNIREGRKALAKRSYWSELGRSRWSGDMATTGWKPLAINIKFI